LGISAYLAVSDLSRLNLETEPSVLKTKKKKSFTQLRINQLHYFKKASLAFRTYLKTLSVAYYCETVPSP
jgi:hypothetical protein